MRILIVEDNAELAGLIAKGFEKANIGYDVAGSCDDARSLLETQTYDLMTLDLGLPLESGMSLLAELRRNKNSLPVLILTARSEITDKVEGLRSGADDYLVKPFALEELIARVQAIVRRPSRIEDQIHSVGNLDMLMDQHTVMINGTACPFSARELRTLEVLIRRKGRVVTKDILEGELFGLHGDLSSNAIEVYVHRLRKLRQDHGATASIHTIRGLGYMLVGPE